MSDPIADALASLGPTERGGHTSPETVVWLLDHEGQEVTITMPGTITADVDGTPTGINPETTTTATLGRVTLTADEWEATARHLHTQTRKETR